MVIFNVEEASDCADIVHMNFKATNLPKMDWIGGGDPYFEIFRQREDNDWMKVYKSPVLSGRKPNWKPFKIQMATLTNGDPHCPLNR
eukprot:UN04070